MPARDACAHAALAPRPLAEAIDGCLEPEPSDRPTLPALADAVTAVASQ